MAEGKTKNLLIVKFYQSTKIYNVSLLTYHVCIRNGSSTLKLDN